MGTGAFSDRRTVVIALALVAVLAAACGPARTSTMTSTNVLGGVVVDNHLAVGCDCCSRWEAYLEGRGAVVISTPDPELRAFKSGLGVPSEASSCHTAVVGGYVVEGHVPAEAIARLLDERPDVVGIAVPGMPLDSPGMGGDETTWGEVDVFLIQPDGQLAPFDY